MNLKSNFHRTLHDLKEGKTGSKDDFHYMSYEGNGFTFMGHILNHYYTQKEYDEVVLKQTESGRCLGETSSAL